MSPNLNQIPSDVRRGSSSLSYTHIIDLTRICVIVYAQSSFYMHNRHFIYIVLNHMGNKVLGIGTRYKVLGHRYWVLGTRYWVLGIRYLVLGTWY